MKKPRIEDLVMAKLYPQRKEIDSNDWQTHIRRNLVQEVRDETVRFYGPTDCLEAQYPGLDYASSAHRMRLGRFPHHRKLFKAFDELRLTDNEIQRLCKWEGTRWAKETCEANNGIKIKDTTWDGIVDARHRRTTATLCPVQPERNNAEAGESSDNEMEYEDEDENDDAEVEGSDEDEEVSEEESEDELEQSVGVQLNERLIAATEARARGEHATMDPDWEQWLKEAAERGAVPNISQVHGTNPTPGAMPQTPVYWGQEIPGYLGGTPTPEHTARQAQLPPPPEHMPRSPGTYASLNGGGPSQSAPSGSATV